MSRAQNDYLFLELPREEPTKRNFSVRTANFGEIYQATEPARIGDQASRCIACGNPYCEWKCPVHNYIPNWLELLAEDRIMEAADLCHATNALPEMCGRICPQDRLCEGACTLNSDYGAVTIGQAEKYIVDTAIQRGWAPDLSGVAPLPYSVGIVGAGPAGLSCADRLRRFGVEAVVYDRYPRIGGLLTFGIPEFKLEKQVVERRRAILEDMGVRFELGVDVGADVQAEELLQRHQALFVATGTYNGVDIGLPGQDAQGVYRALPYLIANTDHIHRIGWGREDYVDLAGEQVLVLGGGDTGMDCNRTAVRQSAASVTCVYRRDEASMPGSAREVSHCREEGVQFRFHAQPTSIVARDGKVEGVRFVRTELGAADASGRRRMETVPDSEFELAATAVITSFGFNASPPAWLDGLGVRTHLDGRLLLGGDAGEGRLPGQTTNPAVFGGGDMGRGADLVVTAVADGMGAAQSILTWLQR